MNLENLRRFTLEDCTSKQWIREIRFFKIQRANSIDLGEISVKEKWSNGLCYLITRVPNYMWIRRRVKRESYERVHDFQVAQRYERSKDHRNEKEEEEETKDTYIYRTFSERRRDVCWNSRDVITSNRGKTYPPKKGAIAYVRGEGRSDRSEPPLLWPPRMRKFRATSTPGESTALGNKSKMDFFVGAFVVRSSERSNESIYQFIRGLAVTRQPSSRRLAGMKLAGVFPSYAHTWQTPRIRVRLQPAV